MPADNKGALIVNCTKCGGAAQQGPNGEWLCPQCGPVSGAVPTGPAATAPETSIGCRP